MVYNTVNTYPWFKEHTYTLDEAHDPLDRTAAFAKAIESDKLPLGVFYKNPGKKVFETELRHGDTTPLYQHTLDIEKFQAALAM